jgi:hypothetical protein
MDKDTSYTAMDDLTPKRSGCDSDTKSPADVAADPPDGGGGTKSSITEEPSIKPSIVPVDPLGE